MTREPFHVFLDSVYYCHLLFPLVMLVEYPHTWIGKTLVNRLQKLIYVFVTILPHIVFILDIYEVQDVGYPFLIELYHPKYR